MRGETKRLLMQIPFPGDPLGRAGESLERDLNDWVTWMSSTPDPLMLSSWWALPHGWLLDFMKQYLPDTRGRLHCPTLLNWQRWSFCLKHCVLWWQEEHRAWSDIIPTPTPAPSLTFYITSSPSSITLSSNLPSLKWKWLAISRRVVPKIKSNEIRSD